MEAGSQLGACMSILVHHPLFSICKQPWNMDDTPSFEFTQGIPLDKQRLIFQGKVLKGDQQLKEYGEGQPEGALPCYE